MEQGRGKATFPMNLTWAQEPWQLVDTHSVGTTPGQPSASLPASGKSHFSVPFRETGVAVALPHG